MKNNISCSSSEQEMKTMMWMDAERHLCLLCCLLQDQKALGVVCLDIRSLVLLINCTDSGFFRERERMRWDGRNRVKERKRYIERCIEREEESGRETKCVYPKNGRQVNGIRVHQHQLKKRMKMYSSSYGCHRTLKLFLFLLFGVMLKKKCKIIMWKMKLIKKYDRNSRIQFHKGNKPLRMSQSRD